MNDIIYDIWLSLCLPIGSAKPKIILDEFKSAKCFYEKLKIDKKIHNVLNNRDITSLENTSLAKAEEIMKRCKKEKIEIVSINCNEFPKRLKHIDTSPIILYIKGDIKDLDDELTLTMVGTRLPSAYANSVAGNLSFQLARAGAVIVSGLAEGLDTLAHLGALKAGRPTIAVLAGGIDVDYPKSNAELKKAIIKSGALISEIPPGRTYLSGGFRLRNRLLAGLSEATIITQAPENSGAIVTAKCAIEQGKKVFCVPPHDIYDSDYKGVSELYEAGNCSMAVSAKYILDKYLNRYRHKLNLELASSVKVSEREKAVSLPKVKSIVVEKSPKWEEEPNTNRKSKNQKEKSKKSSEMKLGNKAEQNQLLQKIKTTAPSGLNEIQKMIWKAIESEKTHPNDISSTVGIEITQIVSELTMLELLGYVKKEMSGEYKINQFL